MSGRELAKLWPLARYEPRSWSTVFFVDHDDVWFTFDCLNHYLRHLADRNTIAAAMLHQDFSQISELTIANPTVQKHAIHPLKHSLTTTSPTPHYHNNPSAAARTPHTIKDTPV
jgi:hypothetical protein